MNGDELRQARQKLGVSQKELGEGLEVSRHSVMRWEQGKWAVPKLVHFAMAYLTGVRVPKTSTRRRKP